MAIAEVELARATRGAFSAIFANEQTFDAWYERALPHVYGYVFARCGRDRDLAEDLTQQTFIEAVRCHERFDGLSDPMTWVCGIARHRLADHYRQLDAQERGRLRLVERLQAQVDTADDTVIAEREAISTALATLPALQRAVLLFSAMDGLTASEVGILIGRSEGAVESLLHRARSSFRRAYGIAEGRDDD
jgi:RNA polymerase sigma-70 factor (ECF subfamily)